MRRVIFWVAVFLLVPLLPLWIMHAYTSRQTDQMFDDAEKRMRHTQQQIEKRFPASRSAAVPSR